MLKVLLMIDCDFCRRLLPYSHTVSEDRTAWHAHSGRLLELAGNEGWDVTDDGNFHYCPSCSQSLASEATFFSGA